MSLPSPSPYANPGDPLSQPLRGASLPQAVQRLFQKYAVFTGRASRSEFWYAYLALVVVSVGLDALGRSSSIFSILGFAFIIATVVPSLAAGARRLHDIGRSGWWQLLSLIPLVGIIVLIVWWATPPKAPGDRFDV